MDPLIQKMCARYVGESLVITRNAESQTLLRSSGHHRRTRHRHRLDLRARSHQSYAQKVLREAGWDGTTPILVICPIHPFCLARKSLHRQIRRPRHHRRLQGSQYRTVYFHESGAEVDRRFQHYISSITNATKTFLQRHRVFPILVAMERLDAVACRAIAAQIPGTPIFTSDDYDMYQLVSLLRACTYMVSSRYHGIVTCMPSLVASAGVTMDERIRNLMRERGHEHLFLTVDDPELEPKLLQIMETLVAERDAVREGIGLTVVRNLKVMARMGVLLEDAVRRQYPEFPLRSGVLSWEDYLPPLSENLQQLLKQYDASPVAMAAKN